MQERDKEIELMKYQQNFKNTVILKKLIEHNTNKLQQLH